MDKQWGMVFLITNFNSQISQMKIRGLMKNEKLFIFFSSQ